MKTLHHRTEPSESGYYSQEYTRNIPGIYQYSENNPGDSHGVQHLKLIERVRSFLQAPCCKKEDKISVLKKRTCVKEAYRGVWKIIWSGVYRFDKDSLCILNIPPEFRVKVLSSDSFGYSSRFVTRVIYMLRY